MRVARRYMWMVLSLGLVLLFGVQGFAQALATGRHRVIVRPGPNDSIAQIKQSGITNVDSYGSYWLVEATGAQVDALKKTLGDRASEADHLNRIELGSISLDTTAPEPAVPTNLQQTAPAGKRLRLIQFKGPIQPEWLEEIKAVGQVKVISYVPNNAYVIWLDETAESDLHKLTVPSGPIQWIGAYHPYYKMDPLLPSAPASSIDVQVGVVNDPGAEQTL